MTSAQEIDLRPLIEEARLKGLWLCHTYYDLWFSPKELENANKEGKFLWGSTNWMLRNPQEHLEYLKHQVAKAEKDLQDFTIRFMSED